MTPPMFGCLKVRRVGTVTDHGGESATAKGQNHTYFFRVRRPGDCTTHLTDRLFALSNPPTVLH